MLPTAAAASYTRLLPLLNVRCASGGSSVWAGQLTLDISIRRASGQEFAPSRGGLPLRVSDVARARTEPEATGVVFHGATIDTAVC
jgi:hypothetical protein